MANKSRRYRRPGRPGRKPSRPPVRPAGPPPESFRPRATKAAQALLRDIGSPKTQPFKADPFQEEAVALAGRADVLVSAPTGSGKTWIAVQAMDRIYKNGGRCWYASPLKALSNAKLLEFRDRFGHDNVGILTGDRKENPDAPLVVGTTEILRNQLYDAMQTGEDLDCDLVVLDEAHYLGDEDRGFVWEEVVIYLPQRVRLLLLSATLANARELADWLASVRHSQCEVVHSTERPVPLIPLFLNLDGEVSPLTSGPGRLEGKLQRLLKTPDRLAKPMYIERQLAALEELNLLPGIFFLPSRADCDQALAYARGKLTERWAGTMAELNREVEAFLAEFPFLRGHPLLQFIRRYGVASHHAGHLPHFRLLVEKLMQRGLLRAIFATSTVAAGVNFPARSVVLPQSDRFDGTGFVDLTATQLAQMTGRAGRRGMDRVGFAVFPPGPHQNLPLIAELIDSEPEPILSQMKLDFSMVLNLLKSHRSEEVRPLLGLSLAAFQAAQQGDASPRPDFLDRLRAELTKANCGQLEQAVIARRSHAQAKSELDRLERDRPMMEERLRLLSLLAPGRVVIDDRNRPWLVRRSHRRGPRQGVLAALISPVMKLKNGRFKVKFLGLDRISWATETVVKGSDDRALAPQLRKLSRSKFRAAKPPTELSGPGAEELAALTDRRERLAQTVAQSPCHDCPLLEPCQLDRRAKLGRWLTEAEWWLDDLAQVQERLWLGFLRRMEFMGREGFIDAEGRLTEAGSWAADLRLDHPLLIAEAIRNRALPSGDPALLAGLMAPFVLDRERAWPRRVDNLRPEGKLTVAFGALEAAIAPLAERQRQADFRTPRLLFAPALAVYRWADGRDWNLITDSFGVAAGDMAALVFRTADNLRQVAGLTQTHPELAATARRAREAILRPPVLVPV